MTGAGAKSREDRVACGRVAQAYREISQPALMPNAGDGAACHALPEARFVPSEQIHQFGAIQSVSHTKVVLVGEARITVPGTHQLAIVATIDPITDEPTQVHRDTAFQLDGQVGDTASRVKLVGS